MQEYSSLLDKYPQSVQLLSFYALFCDGVLNDYWVAARAAPELAARSLTATVRAAPGAPKRH